MIKINIKPAVPARHGERFDWLLFDVASTNHKDQARTASTSTGARRLLKCPFERHSRRRKSAVDGLRMQLPTNNGPTRFQSARGNLASDDSEALFSFSKKNCKINIIILLFD